MEKKSNKLYDYIKDWFLVIVMQLILIGCKLTVPGFGLDWVFVLAPTIMFLTIIALLGIVNFFSWIRLAYLVETMRREIDRRR